MPISHGSDFLVLDMTSTCQTIHILSELHSLVTTLASGIAFSGYFLFSVMKSDPYQKIPGTTFLKAVENYPKTIVPCPGCSAFVVTLIHILSEVTDINRSRLCNFAYSQTFRSLFTYLGLWACIAKHGESI